MSGASRGSLPTCFRGFPGAVLLLSAEGIVVDSNGRLDDELGAPVAGRDFAELLDPESSRGKLGRILALGGGGEGGGNVVWELIFRGDHTLPEPRPFAVLWDDELARFWLMEQQGDPLLADLRDEVMGVNSELAQAQREVLKERSRLARALDDLGELYRRAEELAGTVQLQNDELATRNDRLVSLTAELRARGDELTRSNEALDEFAHVVSHDLKAPLRSIGNYAAWLEEDTGAALNGAAQEHLRRLRGRVARMQAMIKGLLEYARAGRIHAQPERVDVGGLVAAVIDLLDAPARVRIEVETAMPVLVTERAPLQQILLNLIGNAVRYGGKVDEPCVRVGARMEGELHEFYVADNGPGIPARAQERIWGLFHTLEPEARAEGTGIGLALVRKLVEARGMQVWVESEEGAGAAFRFRWPSGGEIAAVA